METPKSVQKFIASIEAAKKRGTATREFAQIDRDYKRESKREIEELIAQNIPFQTIGKMFGLSKQRIEQIANPQAEKARRTINQAIKSKKLTRLPCRVCGDPKSEAHHEDYSKPLEVVWLCHTHHVAADIERRGRAPLS